MAKNKHYLSGLSFRKLKKTLKSRAKAETLETVTGVFVRIQFSREIAYWGATMADMCYHENPRFTAFWVNMNKRLRQKKYRDRYGAFHVACYSHEQEERDRQLYEEGKVRTGYAHYLVEDCGSFCTTLSPTMGFFYTHSPSRFRTFVDAPLMWIINIMEDCAKYCGGTVEISYSLPQRMPFDRTVYRALTLGKQ